MILDTNAISALSNRDPKLIDKMGTLTNVSTTLINLGEYHFGILGSSHKTELLHWIQAFLEHVELLQPNLNTLPHYANIRNELKTAGTPIPANDVWIAALARQYQLPLLSKDSHFDFVKGMIRHSW